MSLLTKAYRSVVGLPFLLNREILGNWKVLDVGCGKNSPIKFVRKDIHKVGLDYYVPYINQSKKGKLHHEYIIGDVRKLPFKKNEFDCAIAIEILEHLNKKDGKRMIMEMARVSKSKIILTTPNGFWKTYAGPKDNPDETHISGWTVNELKNLGFIVRGLNGPKSIWTINDGRTQIKRPRIIFNVIRAISEPLIYYLPNLSFQLFCVKKMKK